MLIPLLQSLQKNVMRAFDPLPYTELPGVHRTPRIMSSFGNRLIGTPSVFFLKKGNRYFLVASQLLNDIKANPLNLAGVLFWDKRRAASFAR